MPFWKKSEDPWDYEPEKRPVPSAEAGGGEDAPGFFEELRGDLQNWNQERKEKKAQRQTPPPPMKCPWCGQEMEVGYVTSGRDAVRWWPGWPPRVLGPGDGCAHPGGPRGHRPPAVQDRLSLPRLPPDGAGDSRGGDPKAPDAGGSGGAGGRTASAGGPAENQPRTARLRCPPGGGRPGGRQAALNDIHKREKTDQWHSSISSTGPWGPARPPTP